MAYYPAIYKHVITPVQQGDYKSIWDQTLIANVYIDTSNGSEISYNNWSATDYVDISGNTDGIIYRLGRISQANYNAFYDSNKTFISSCPISDNNGGNTIPSNAKYVRFSFNTVSMVGDILIKKE